MTGTADHEERQEEEDDDDEQQPLKREEQQDEATPTGNENLPAETNPEQNLHECIEASLDKQQGATVNIDAILEDDQVDDDEQKTNNNGTTDTGSVSSASVSFANIHVREYERVIDPSMYMGLALGWRYQDNPPLILEKETGVETKSKSTKTFKAANATPLEDETKKEANIRASRKHQGQRYQVFMNYGYSRKELKGATSEYAKFMKQQQKQLMRESARRLCFVKEESEHQLHPSSKTTSSSSTTKTSSPATTKQPQRRFLRSLFR